MTRMRPPIYDWEDKKQICYELYVDQKKSMEEIRTYMKERYGFEPRCVRPGGSTEVQYLLLYPNSQNGHN